MAIKIGSNFTFQGEQPNFERDRFVTKAGMKAFPETSIDDGHLSYCAEDGNTYQFKSSNSVDVTTGKWRLFKDDVDLSAYATKDSVAAGLDKKVNIIGKRIYSSSIKVATIPVTVGYKTITVTIDLRCRSSNFVVNVIVKLTNDINKTTIQAYNESYSSNISEKVYYYFDKSTENDYKVIIFYSAEQLDTVFGKITTISGDYSKLPILNMEAVTTFPEDVVLITNVNYNRKNRFYATPIYKEGFATFRTIDVADLPDLSSKYATKAKAFTTDTVSTAPGQFVAGPATTQGNLYLRKIDASDIPDLKSKYQPINGNGIQEGPRAVGLSVGYRAQIGYLKALISASDTTSQLSPDWYFATDGTLQNITTKIPKITLDDAVSTTSDNGVKNSVITKYVDGKVTTINNNITDLHSSLESTQTDFVDLRNKVNAMPKTVFITQAAYNALTTKDANTIYYING